MLAQDPQIVWRKFLLQLCAQYLYCLQIENLKPVINFKENYYFYNLFIYFQKIIGRMDMHAKEKSSTQIDFLLSIAYFRVVIFCLLKKTKFEILFYDFYIKII